MALTQPLWKRLLCWRALMSSILMGGHDRALSIYTAATFCSFQKCPHIKALAFKTATFRVKVLAALNKFFRATPSATVACYFNGSPSKTGISHCDKWLCSCTKSVVILLSHNVKHIVLILIFFFFFIKILHSRCLQLEFGCSR